MRYPDLPKSCPECEAPFGEVYRPKPRVTIVGKLLIGLGILLAFPLFLVFAVFQLLVGFAMSPDREAAAFMSPAVWIASFADRFRVVRLRCHMCGWHHEYPMSTGNGAKK